MRSLPSRRCLVSAKTACATHRTARRCYRRCSMSLLRWRMSTTPSSSGSASADTWPCSVPPATRGCGGLATVGGPLRTFFTDPEQWARTPQTTRRTLARLTNTAEAELPAMLMYWALTDEQLAALDIPVYYVA